MKIIELKAARETVVIPQLYVVNGEVLENVEREIIITTYGLLREIVNKPMQGGCDIEQMMQRLKIMALVDKHKSSFNGTTKLEDMPVDNKIEIEDADFQELFKWVKDFRWGVVANFIVDFANNFK